jgi:myo-inositol-1(or 4)-monophosphatase
VIAVAVAAARAAGAIIQGAAGNGISAPTLPGGFAGGARVSHKGAIDLVTRIDLAAEAAIRAVLAERTPDIAVLAEEGGGARAAATRWIVDPLDGTTNFVHGFPAYAVSIGLQVDGVMEVGCIYDPLRDHLYTATRGGGAACNGTPIRVSTESDLGHALLLTGFPYDRQQRAAEYLRIVQAFLERCRGIRRAGSAALDFAHIAAGRADGFWELGLSPWDVSAGVLLVAEAGGTVTDMSGGPLDIDRPRVLASNGQIHAEMARVLSGLIS